MVISMYLIRSNTGKRVSQSENEQSQAVISRRKKTKFIDFAHSDRSFINIRTLILKETFAFFLSLACKIMALPSSYGPDVLKSSVGFAHVKIMCIDCLAHIGISTTPHISLIIFRCSEWIFMASLGTVHCDALCQMVKMLRKNIITTSSNKNKEDV